MWNKFLMIIDGKSDNVNTIDVVLGVFFITLGINAIFITSYRLPTTLYVINFCMAVIGVCYLVLALTEYKILMVRWFIEVLAFGLLILNGLLATIGVNDHADPISCAVFGIILFTVKMRREWLENTGRK